jgi:hypothetical protein
MPAIVFIFVLAILFKIFPGSVLIPVMLWALIVQSPAEAILSFCRAHGLEDDWAINITLGISLFMFAVPASYFAWKWWRVAGRREFYFNLFVLAVGIPAAVIFGLRVTRWQ